MYLCTRNSKERGFGSVWALWVVVKFCWWAWRWARLYIIGVRRTSEALEKETSPKIWWIQKLVVPLHSQLQRKGGRKCPIHGWSLVAMIVDRNACGVYMMARLHGWSRGFLNTSFWYSKNRSTKKTSPKIWWFQKLVVPLHSQPTRKGGSLFTCEEVLSWGS